MRILLIAHAFPPYGASGALRPANVVKALRARGHDVHVITSRLPGESNDIRVSEPRLTVSAIRYVPNPRYLYVAAKNALKRNDGKPSTPLGSAVLGEARSIASWKRYVLSFLRLPDDQQGFIVAAFFKALLLHRKEPFDLVYTTSPIISTHVAGLLLKRVTGIRWVAEFRDLWTQDPYRARAQHLQTRASFAVERWLELRFLLDSDNVVAVSEGIQRNMMQRVPEHTRDKFVLARNGIAVLESQRPLSSPSAPLRVVYLGSLGLQRDPRPFLAVMAQMRRTMPELEVTLDFAGDCEWYQDVHVPSVVDELGLSGSVRFHGWLAHQDGQNLMRSADVLLLLAQQQPDAVPNKLYEYLGSRKPILAFADQESETAALLRQAGDHFLITEHDDENAIRAALVKFAHERRTPAYGNEAALRRMTTSAQMAHLADALGL